MKFSKTLSLILAAGAIALTATPTFSNNSSQTPFSFDCKLNKGGILTTVASNAQKPGDKEIKEIIFWKSEFIDSSDINADCHAAANVLQTHFNEKPSSYLAQDTHQGQVVVCLVQNKQQGCFVDKNNKLLWLKKDFQDSANVIKKVVNPDYNKLEPPPGTRGYGRIIVTISPLKWW
ncbi:MAG TPA: COP23 domain-containing protein [Oculatellaceae cyanobacterium]|jgi:hypothetical protein